MSDLRTPGPSELAKTVYFEASRTLTRIVAQDQKVDDLAAATAAFNSLLGGSVQLAKEHGKMLPEYTRTGTPVPRLVLRNAQTAIEGLVNLTGLTVKSSPQLSAMVQETNDPQTQRVLWDYTEQRILERASYEAYNALTGYYTRSEGIVTSIFIEDLEAVRTSTEFLRQTDPQAAIGHLLDRVGPQIATTGQSVALSSLDGPSI